MSAGAPFRYRNFDTLRLLAASAVIFSHSFAITDGAEGDEPFVRLLGEGNILGLYGVFTFFILSGFLITQSFVRRRTTVDYLVKRCARIFPGVIVCAVICGFVIGGLMTTLPLREYLTDREVYRYVAKTSLLLNTSDYGLPGVKFWDNDFGWLINGSMWTLGPEFLCYLAVAILGVLGLLRLPVALILLAVGLYYHDNSNALGYLMMFFAAGSALWFVHERARPGHGVLALCGVGLIAAAALGHPQEGFTLFGAVLVIQLGTTARVSLGRGARFGDVSYGMYLYGWPAEALIRRGLGDAAEWWMVFGLAVPAAAFAGFLSWHLVEKRALRLAGPVSRYVTGKGTALQTALQRA